MKYKESGYGFGSFKGVFTPSILTILGVVMYLRFGWVLGNVGILLTLIIVSLSTLVTFLTAFSLSSLATNMRVEGGGAYYIISRSLGLETGAAIGLPLFLAQALGISFYISGFSESVTQLFPIFSPVTVGVLTLMVLTFLAYISADLALKMQLFIMFAITASLISLFMGSPLAEEVINSTEISEPTKLPFWVVFAVFFPAVTGIEAGISLSGDLKNPAKSLPVGTFSAIGVGFLIYLAIPLFMNSLSIPDNVLINDPLIMKKIAWSGELIILGLWGASLSSAMGALLGAPRTLQALSLDGILPKFLGKGYGSNNDPRLATILSFLIGLAGIIMGDLNVIAPVLSMFFLTSYCLLNLSAGFESLVSAPSWRPTFKSPTSLHFSGGVICLIIMLMIDAGTSILALFITGSVYFYFKKKSLQSHFGDARGGIIFSIVKASIDHLSRTKLDTHIWKPNILALCGHPGTRWYLVDFANTISTGGKSLLSIASILPGKKINAERISKTEKVIHDYISKRGIRSHVKVLRSRTVYEGLTSLVEAYGFGPITPNTILVGATEVEEHIEPYTSLLELICELKKNLVVLRVLDNNVDISSGKNIDIWWARRSNNGALMLALAYQMKKSKGWSKANIRLKTIVEPDDQNSTEDYTPLEKFIQRERIPANAVEVVKNGSVFNTIKESSRDTDLVFLGLKAPEEEPDNYERYYRSLLDNTKKFPPVVFAYAAEEIEFKDLFSQS